MNRLMLTAALILAATPAVAQRLDTRMRDVRTEDDGVHCTGNANSALKLFHRRDGSSASAKLFQPPVKPDPKLNVALGMGFNPREGTRYGSGPYLYGVRVIIKGQPAPPVVNARLRLDGADGGFRPTFLVSQTDRNTLFLSTPGPDLIPLGKRVLDARWIDLDLLDAKGKVLRSYRFDGERIRDAAETLSIIKFNCRGPKTA